MAGFRRSALLFASLLLAACREAALPEAEEKGREVAAGERIYLRKCASCHNVNGDGNTITARRFPYANLIDKAWRLDGRPETIERQIRRGQDPMPGFEGKLTDEQIRQTVAYVLELARRKAAERDGR